jgi:glycosyl transferase GT4 family
MKILVLSNNAAGLVSLRRELIEALVERYDVSVCVPHDDYTTRIIEMGAKLIEVDMNRRGKKMIEEIKTIGAYKKIMQREKPDVVLTYTIKPNIYGGLVCRKLKIPYITNITGLGTELQSNSLFSRILMLLYMYGIKKAKKVFVQNTEIQKKLARYGISNNQCELLPGSGVNLTKHCYEAYPTEKQGIRFLFIGRVMKDKGIEELIYAARKVVSVYYNVIFDIIGYYDESKYKEQIDELTQRGVMRIFPFQENIHDVIKEHHCIIHPSYHEGMANALLEAAAVGRPVIASDIPGCRETFDDGLSGIAVKVKDKESLKLGIERFLSMAEGAHEKMGIAGRKKVEECFDRRIVIGKYRSALDEIEGEPNR